MRQVLSRLIVGALFFVEHIHADTASDAALLAETMRGVQARRQVVRSQSNSTNFVTWPKCLSGQEAPSFPSNEFYAGEMEDPTRATELVKAVRSAWNNVYGTASLHTRFVKMDSVEGASSIPSFVNADFPFLTVVITAENHRLILQQMFNALANLDTVRQDAKQVELQGAGGLAGASSSNDPAYNQTAMANCLAMFNSGWQVSSDPIRAFTSRQVVDQTWYPYSSVANYKISNRKGRISYDFSEFYSNIRAKNKTASIFLQLNQGGYTLIGPFDIPTTTSPGNIPTDNKFHYWKDISNPNGLWKSEEMGSQMEPFPTVNGKASWQLNSASILIKFQFDVTPDEGITCCGDSCSTGNCVAGGVEMGLDSIHVQIGAGSGGKDNGSAYFLLNRNVMTSDLSTPAALTTVAPSSVEKRTASGATRQLITKDTFVDIVPDAGSNAPFRYEIRFYPLTAKGTLSGGFYGVVAGSVPFKTVRIENPALSATVFDQLKITEIVGPSTKESLYTFTQPDGVDTWRLSTGNGEKTESLSETWNPGRTIRTEVRMVSQGSTTLSKTKSVYTTFSWGEEKTQEINDPDGTSPLTSSWTYHEVPTGNGYGRVQQWMDGKGYWERYEYDANGSLAKTTKQFLDAPVAAGEGACEVELIDRPDVNTTRTIRKVQGLEVARTYVTFPDATTRRDEVCTVVGAALGAASSLATITKYTDSTRGKIASVRRPDGTMSIYTRSSTTETVKRGAPNAGLTDIIDGTSTVTTTNNFGQVISTVTTTIGGLAATLQSEVGSNPDAYGRSQMWTYNDGTTRAVQYGCCGIESETNREGITTDYTYDAFGNVDTETRAGITLDYDYDALGQLLRTTRIGTGAGGISVVTQGASYDLAGRQTSTTDMLGTTPVTEVYANGRKTRTESLLGGATRIEVSSTDGKVLSIGGTATHGIMYGYGAANGGEQYTFETEASGPWVKRYTDMAGRSGNVEYADGAVEQTFYNAKGQMETRIDADGVSTTFGYNTKGEQETRTVGNRVAKIVRSISTQAGGEKVQKTTVSETGDVVVSAEEQSLSSRSQWRIEYDQLTSVVTTGTGTNVVRTTTAPDASTTVEKLSNGGVVERTSPAGKTLYTYDVNGRLGTETDVRTGRLTTYAYNSKDQLLAKTVNGGTSGSQTTGYTYKADGKLNTVTLPGTNRTASYDYWPTGELKKVFGTAEYPIDYTYDAQGRMKTMVTTAGTTTWTYDPRRGWLDSKSDGVNPAVRYTYFPSGRLKSRTWSRGILTNYKYTNTGDLSRVDYSDSTPSTIITYDNRGRQETLRDAAGLHTYSYWMAGAVGTRLVSGDAITGNRVLNGVNLTNTYDAKLRRATFTAARDGATLASYTDSYDGASRHQTVTDNLGLGLSATYAYLANSSLVDTVVLKQSGTVRVTLDKDFDGFDRQRLSSTIPSSGGPISYTYGYDPAGQRETATFADNSTWTYQYGNADQVVAGIRKWGDGSNVFGQSYSYDYDGIGNRVTTNVSGRAAQYSRIFGLNQYSNRTVPGYVNIVGEVNAAVTNLTVNASAPSRQNGNTYFHRELAVTNVSNPVYLTTTTSATTGGITSTVTGKVFVPKTVEVFSYDADGNLTGDGRWKYGWDAENRLIFMETLPAAVTAGAPKQRLSFAYDSRSRRISKKVESWDGTNFVEHHTFLYLYDGWNVAAEVYKQTGQAVRSYVWGADMSGGQAAGGIGGLLFIRQFPENKSFSVGYDGNGNVAALHDMADASLAARYEYGPFGELIRASGYYAPVNPIRWSTKYQDQESDLVYYGYRFYNSETGRWMSRDPIEEQGGVNLYGMVGNNPISRIDWLGLAYGARLTKNEAKSLACALKFWLVDAKIINDILFWGDDDYGYTIDFLSHYLNKSGTPKWVSSSALLGDPSIQEANELAKSHFKGSGGSPFFIGPIRTGGDLGTALGRVNVSFIGSSNRILGSLENERYDFHDIPAAKRFPKLEFEGILCCWKGGELVSGRWMQDLEKFGFAKSFPVYGIWGIAP